MDAARYRILDVPEDAADGCRLIAPEPIEATEVDISESWPDWHCECGTLNAGREFACGYCGTVREDIDAL